MARKSSAKQPTMQLNVLGPATPPAAPGQGPGQQGQPAPGQAAQGQPQTLIQPQPPAHQQQTGRSAKTVPIIALVAVLLAAGGGLTWALWPKSKAAPRTASPMHVVPGTVQAAVLTPDEVSKAVGTTVVAGPVVNQPPAALSADPASCAVAVGPATVSGYTQGWTVFLSTTYEDSTGSGDYTVTQTVGVYGAADQASAVFGKLGDGVKACPSATRKTTGQGSVKWNYTVGTATADTLTWTAAQDSGGGWACYRQARLKGKDVMQVAVCEGGDGKAAVKQIADQFAARVSG